MKRTLVFVLLLGSGFLLEATGMPTVEVVQYVVGGGVALFGHWLLGHE